MKSLNEYLINEDIHINSVFKPFNETSHISNINTNNTGKNSPEAAKTAFEGVLDDIDTNIEQGDRALVLDFLDKNYTWVGLRVSDKPNKKGLYEVSAKGVTVTNLNIEYLTNDMFEFTEVAEFSCFNCKKLKSLKGSPRKALGFSCGNCYNLKSLKGGPEFVERRFSCDYCVKLKSLEGAPTNAVKHFMCEGCHALKNLKGAPKRVERRFVCGFCKGLESLEGAPSIVPVEFDCSFCQNLKSLKGCPEKVNIFDCSHCIKLESLEGMPNDVMDVICYQCGKNFTEDEVYRHIKNVNINILTKAL